MILWIFSQKDTTEIGPDLPSICRGTNSVKSFPDLPKEVDPSLTNTELKYPKDNLSDKVEGQTDGHCVY